MPRITPDPRARADIPPMRLEDIHGALKGDFRPPRGSARLLGLLALIGLLLLIWYALRAPEEEGGGAAAGNTDEAAAPRPVDPRERERRLQERILENTAFPQDETEVELPRKVDLGPVPDGHTRVAAIQIYSAFGDPEYNRIRMKTVLEQAAEHGVQVAVFPEAAVCGYADVTECRYWTQAPPAPEGATRVEERTGKLGEESVSFWAVINDVEDLYYELYDVRRVAESADGESVRFFAGEAARHGMYVTVPLIEADGDAFYSAAVLVGPSGKTLLHERKRQLWETGDAHWATPSTDAPRVAGTPRGRLGINFTYGVRRLPAFAEQKADIVLQCSALYGRDFEEIFLSSRFLGAIRKARFSLAIANWVYRFTPAWEGYGMSRIILPSGTTKRIRVDDREGMVIADVPVGAAKPTAAASDRPARP